MQYSSAFHRYYELAQTAYQAFSQVAGDITTKWIGESELEVADQWELHPHRKVEWSWRAILRRERKIARRFEAAFLVDGVLCGLLTCRVSKSRVNVNVKFIEGSPYSHPLKNNLLAAVLTQVELYAVTVGARSVAIQKPLPAIVPYYESFDYELEALDKARRAKGRQPRYDQLIKRLTY